MNEITKHLTIIGSEESNWLGVPTLSEIHQYLAKKLRALDLDSIADKSTWDLINLLAKTPAAVNNLMRYFYEPTDEESSCSETSVTGVLAPLGGRVEGIRTGIG